MTGDQWDPGTMFLAWLLCVGVLLLLLLLFILETWRNRP